MRILCSTLFVLCALPLRAQPLEADPGLAGLGGAGIALSGNLWGRANPAATAALQRPALGVAAALPFGLSALRTSRLQGVWPTRHLVASAGLGAFGGAGYTEVQASLGASRGLALGSARRLQAGLRVDAVRVQISGYGAAEGVTLAAGWQVQVAPRVTLAAQAHNLLGHSLDGVVPLPRGLGAGLCLAPAGARLVLDVVKDVRHPLSVRGGAEVPLAGGLHLQAGAAGAPTRWTAGLAVRLRRLSAQASMDRHATLGWTPALALAWGGPPEP